MTVGAAPQYSPFQGPHKVAKPSSLLYPNYKRGVFVEADFLQVNRNETDSQWYYSDNEGTRRLNGILKISRTKPPQNPDNIIFKWTPHH